MGLCFALPLAALASCLLPADCCVICDQAVLTALKSLKENYLPEHLDIKSLKTVMERAEQIIVEFKDLPMKDGSFLGAMDNSTLEKASRSLLKELKRITDSNVKVDEYSLDLAPSGLMLQRLLWCPDCRIGNYHCWKSLDCGERLVKVHEKENLTLNCLFKWHLIAQELTDYKFERIWEDGSETLLYEGKNPIFTITSLTQKNTGTYRCELGTKTSGPATIIHYLVTGQSWVLDSDFRNTCCFLKGERVPLTQRNLITSIQKSPGCSLLRVCTGWGSWVLIWGMVESVLMSQDAMKTPNLGLCGLGINFTL
uniref:Izumo protein immunoglobulin domain-containing protein n=1 Tax=Spermophilus dauricus TaxID=99837 RepID=A0A8C9P3X5_SPEDA